MVLIASIQCHHGDTGGGVPGGYNITATDIWGEGVRWPVVKVIDRGVERRDVLYALQTNNRIPSYIGDLRAQIGSAQLGVARLGEIIDRYSASTVEASVDAMIDYASRRFREEVAQWPDGVYEGDAYVDHDPLGNPDVHLHVKVTVAGDALTIDFTGSDSRPELQAWSTYGNTRGYTVGQIAAMMDPEIPKNEGSSSRSSSSCRKVVCSTLIPASRLSAGTHHPGADVGEVIAVAMQHVLPERAVPQTYKTGIPTIIAGIDPRTGASFTDHSGRGLRRMVQRLDGHGRLGSAQRELRQLVEGDRRDQRIAVSAHPVEPRLPHRFGRSRPVARDLRQPLRKGSPRRLEGLHLRCRDEVSDARHLRADATAHRTK